MYNNDLELTEFRKPKSHLEKRRELIGLLKRQLKIST